MTSMSANGTAPNPDKLQELLGRVVNDMGAAASGALVALGDRLGLYNSLAQGGPTTSQQLAERTRLSERMVREWLLNQAAGGYIQYDPSSCRFSMSPEQRAVLADERGPAFMCGGYDVLSSMYADIEKVRGAFIDGKGLPWSAHDACLFCGTERFFAPNYRGNLVSSWLPALDGMVSRLEQAAQVADVGCGHGASTMIMAAAFPRSRFVGYDFHAPSIQCSRGRAKEAGLKNISFEVADATSFPAPAGGFDLVCCFDCLHDMGDPTGCGKHVRKSLKPDGAWMVVEPAAGDTVQDNLNPVGRLFAAASTMICVPASMASGGPALGACAGPKKLREVITSAGFNRFRIATSTPFNLVIEARP